MKLQLNGETLLMVLESFLEINWLTEYAKFLQEWLTVINVLVIVR